ncbi:MAG: uroporphyrinogen decarboxylase [Opitutales bacterium]
MNSRDLFHSAISLMEVERPPFWIMRQAGRYLPEYRKLKEKYSFVEIVKNPELCLEVALQPMERFDFDCSILFSDILVVSEALGFAYGFKETGGIYLERKIECEKDIENISVEGIREKLSYVAEALKLLRKTLPNKAVLGFSASPFTLGAYMIEGSSSKDNFPKYREFIEKSPELFNALMQKLTEAISEYAQMQIECGIDGFQIFDSHASLCNEETYGKLSGSWTSSLISSMEARARTILYAKGLNNCFGELAKIGADAYSVDSSMKLSELKQKWVAPYALQGNLDQTMLETASPDEVKKAVREIVDDMKNERGHIFNLGHGITPNAKLENVYAICEAIKE